MRNIVPIKMYEYMAAGKVVLASPLEGIRREFGEGNGVVYADSPKEMMDIILDLADTERLRIEGGKARRYVEGYDWRIITDEFEHLLASLRRFPKTDHTGEDA